MTTDPMLRSRRRLPAAGVLLLGALLSVVTWMAVARADLQALEQEHERRFSQIAYEVESRTIQARNVLRGLEGLFIASDEVSRMDFHQYARALQIEDGSLGLQAVQFARLVEHAQRYAFEARVRADTTLQPGGYPQFSILPPGPRTFYVATEYNEPMRGNEAAFGFDTAYGPVLMAALQAARDSGEARASAPFRLVQGPYTGVVLRAPVYRNGAPTSTVQERRDAYMGQVSVVFIVDTLLGAALGNHFGADTQVTLTDLGSITDVAAQPAADSLLGRYGQLPVDSAWRTPLDTAQTLIVSGRFWQVRMQSLPVNPYVQVKALTAGALVFALTLLALTLAGRVLAQRDSAQALASGLRETLNQSEARAAALLDATLTGIITLDSTDRICSANPAAAALFGYPEAQLEGMAFKELVPGLRPDDLRAGTTHDVTVLTRDQRSLPVAMSLGEVRYGDEYLLLASFYDMTAQKRLEEQQRAFAQAMDDTVRARTAELTRVNEELEAFAYSVAHDLRAPARHVYGFARVIEQRHASQLDATALNYLGRIQRASADMGRLVDGMLAFAQLGDHAMLPTDVDLAALVQRVQATLEPDLEGRRVQWHVGPLPVVRADQSLMAQVMTNLLGNAVKYSARSDPAMIEVFADASVPGEHRICVADNGIGIDMRHAPRLFRVFSRLHHANEFEGTGVGLATVQRILERHGGRAWVESEPGRGARFWFALPA
jgi:PAS domain S-box-containing protein